MKKLKVGGYNVTIISHMTIRFDNNGKEFKNIKEKNNIGRMIIDYLVNEGFI